MFSKIKEFFAEKVLNTYGKSLIRKLLMAASGFIVAKAPILEPLADAITSNLDHFTSSIIAAILAAVAASSSYEDKRKEQIKKAQEVEDAKSEALKLAKTTKKKVVKKKVTKKKK